MALSAYPRMVNMLSHILDQEFHPPKIDFYQQYVLTKTHLQGLRAKLKRLFEVANKSLSKAKMGSLRLSTDQMTRLVPAYTQSNIIHLLSESVENDLTRTVANHLISANLIGNFILSLLLVGAGSHRSEALHKISIGDFEHAVFVEGRRVIQVFDHKTRASTGAAMIPLCKLLIEKMMVAYLNSNFQSSR